MNCQYYLYPLIFLFSAFSLLCSCLSGISIDHTNPPDNPNDINGHWYVKPGNYFVPIDSMVISNSEQIIMYQRGINPISTTLEIIWIDIFYIRGYEHLINLKCIQDSLTIKFVSLYDTTNDGENIIGSHWFDKYLQDTFYMPSDTFMSIDSTLYVYNSIDSTLIRIIYNGQPFQRTEIDKLYRYKYHKLYREIYSEKDSLTETIKPVLNSVKISQSNPTLFFK